MYVSFSVYNKCLAAIYNTYTHISPKGHHIEYSSHSTVRTMFHMLSSVTINLINLDSKTCKQLNYYCTYLPLDNAG